MIVREALERAFNVVLLCGLARWEDPVGGHCCHAGNIHTGNLPVD